MNKTPKICIVGLQHQGIVQAVCFAQMGYQVVGVGEDREIVAMLNSEKSPINEPEVEVLLRENLRAGRLKFTGNYIDALLGAEFVFLSVDIYFNKNGVDIESIRMIAQEIILYKSTSSILCVTTQVPVGTSETLTLGSVAYIPEFLRPGQSVNDFRYADRIVIGSDDPAVYERVARLYQPLRRPIIAMGLRSAEMSKHAHNAILATQISFINEIARLCKKVGANVEDVARSTKADHRVGVDSYLNPGWGLSGGHLIRDVRVLQNLGRESACMTPLLNAVVTVDRIREEGK